MVVRATSILVLLSALGIGCTTTGRDNHGATTQVLNLEQYLPSYPGENAVPIARDRWQRMMDAAEGYDATIVFPARDYRIVDAVGLRVPSNCTVVMEGARLLVDEGLTDDGQVFVVEDAVNVTFVGGEIVGRRDTWDVGTNIAGIRVLGASDNIHVMDTRFRDLSSNAIGVFGAPERPITGVVVENVTATNCCNVYTDYLQPNKGPAVGSVREDQGAVAFYHVNDWRVEACCFDGSRSDGTHFFKSNRGRFIDNHVIGSTMGGYFLEGCEYVIASGNLVSENGSRGVTIERDSRHCTLSNNVIEFSGREGLWAPDVEYVTVEHNHFRENGRKDDGDRDSQIRIDDTAEYATATRAITVRKNRFECAPEQQCALYVTGETAGLVVDDNAFEGNAPPMYVARAE